MSRKTLIKSTGVIGIATGASRILGFVRDIVIAGLFGTSMAAQAFVVAFRIPNTLRDIVGEGAANAAIVPVLSEYEATKSREEFLHLFRVIFNVLAVILIILSAAGVLFSPVIVRLMAPGFIQDPALLSLTISLNRLVFPYIFLVGLSALAMGVLNSLKHFSTPAFGMCIVNIALIVSALTLGERWGAYSLVCGVLVGGVLQLAVNIPVLYSKGLSFGFADGFRHPAGQKIMRLMMPRILGTGVYQINIFIDTIIASLGSIVGMGGVAALYFSNRIIQFPLGIFGVALAQAALPKMSQEAARNDLAELRSTLLFSLRMVLLISVPSAVGLLCLGKPIIRTLFERGEFGAYSTSITHQALFYYAFGLVSFSMVKLLVTCFYSLHDTMTPVKTAVVVVVTNLVLSLLLMWPLKLGGLALATSVSATLNVGMLYRALRKKIGPLGGRSLADMGLRVTVAAIAMGAVSRLLWFSFGCEGISSAVARFFALIAVVILSCVVYLVSAHLLGVSEVREVVRWPMRHRTV